MDKRIGKIEILFALLVLIIFLLVTGKYVAGTIVREITKNQKQYSLEANRRASYWNFILHRDEYFPDSKLEFVNGSLTLSYAKDFAKSPVITQNVVGIPVLLFHGITDDPKPGDITPEQFRELMIRLKKEGYYSLSIKEFYEFAAGRKQLDSKAILLTFDDGRKDSYYNADPVLRVLNYRAVMFVITDHSLKGQKKPYYLSTDELIQMLSSNRWDLQSHGDSDHKEIVINETGETGSFMGQKLWLANQMRTETDAEFVARLTKDLVYAKDSLERLPNNSVIAYAFPFGDFGQFATTSSELVPQVKALAKSIYPLSFIQFRSERDTGYYRGAYRQEGAGIFKRILISRSDTPDSIMQKIESSTPKSLPFDFNNKSEAWIAQSDGDDVTVQNGVRIHIQVPELGNTAEAYLDGTYSWKNYSFSGTFEPDNIAQFAVVGRSLDGNNYVSCEYGYNKVDIKQITNGQEVILSQAYNRYFQPYPGAKVTLRIELSDTTVSCYVDNLILAQSPFVSPSLDHGSAGFKVWRLFEGEASATVSGITAH